MRPDKYEISYITRLISIVSQPIKAFVVVVVVFIVCVLVFDVVVVLGHRNITSKFGQNWVRNS